ncbi:hypothetical protein M9Y10_028330 [Tritrichomonas musculus]|uniref:GOLD domain-containing protein n=1 Tax=Tritrichomonas musculus TaxID=1915356 RepID=A0ABR2KMC3_9EUKA
MADDLESKLDDLKNLVLTFEYENCELSSVPQEQIDFFGYACLSNSLMYKEQPIPRHDVEGITQYFRTHIFTTLDSLIFYINNLSSEIDRLFAIFAWEALNIKYDVDSLLTNEQKDYSLEEIFENKAAVSEGYSLFFCEMAKRIKINTKRIKITKYHTFSKAFGYDPLNIPTDLEPDHSSLLIKIDKIAYISDPSWAAGNLNSDNLFEWNYRPEMFLIPIVKTLCDRMPCDDIPSLLPFNFTFEDFFKSCCVSPIGIRLKTESNPFVRCECVDGYACQIYSCIAPINWIQIHLYKQDPSNKEIFTEVPNESITSYEVVQEMIPNHHDRCRFRTNIAFQEEGFYKVEIFIDGPLQISYFVNNLAKSELPVPISYNPFHKSKFIPIKPTRMLSKVKHGVALIRFAVSQKQSEIIWNIIKLVNEDTFVEEDGQTISREYGRFIKLEIPFDNTRYEDQLCITFPSNGRYSIQIYLANDVGSYTSYAKYFIDVSGTESRDTKSVLSPTEFMYNGRDFSTFAAFDDNKNQIKIVPNQTCHIINSENELEQTIQLEDIPGDQNILLEFRKSNKLIANPTLIKQRNQTYTYKWSIPNKEGEYQLLCWINEYFSFSISYIYRKGPLRNQTNEELSILGSLKQKIILNNQYEKGVNGENADDDNSNVKKHSSKCCLLI